MIDTAPKRRSVAGISIGWGITPDATPGVEWRQQVAWSYSGIAPGGAPPAPSGVGAYSHYASHYDTHYRSFYGSFSLDGEDGEF